MILLLDNFDSFTFNLVDYLEQAGTKSKVFRNDVPLSEITKYQYKGVVLSPGPETPQKAGNLMEVLAYYYNKLPVFGICLGHQAIGEFFGADLKKGIKPMHGKVSKVTLDTANPLFNNIPNEINVVRYNSLVIDNIRNPLKTIGVTTDGEVMAVSHLKYNIWGVQFHPEAALTQNGIDMVKNWVRYNNIAF